MKPIHLAVFLSLYLVILGLFLMFSNGCAKAQSSGKRFNIETTYVDGATCYVIFDPKDWPVGGNCIK